ncbi:MAG TPA: protein translocase subunit SecF [Verrucomicrobiae bacterium]|nr:protein translocase subunit SecF [Verrucomicrobiae bacterium]
MEFFRNTKIDFLGKKWYFLGFSLIFSIAGIVSMAVRHHKTGDWVPLGIDFRGGTNVVVKFTSTPNTTAIRAALDRVGLHNARIQTFDDASKNEVLIALDQKDTSESDTSRGQNLIIQSLATGAEAGKKDLNNVGADDVAAALVQRDPTRAAPDEYKKMAQAIKEYRTKNGIFKNMDELTGVVPAPVAAALKQDFYSSNFSVQGTTVVGPQVGGQLQRQAELAVFFSLIGMLVYLWFRFELIYGVAAVVAVFHDTLITIGAFSLTNKEITLTVIAAVLTLVGYSMNDTIVVFDRIRENVKLMRRESLAEIVNRSINQTLSRTILTSGLTFLTVLSLYLFGGEVLNGFSFALVIGIIIGTYSSIAVAAPMLVAYQDWRASRSGRRMPVKAKA